jgi:hypothetical protein
MIEVAPSAVSVSMITLRLGSRSVTRKTERPPIASSGFRITSPLASMKSWSSDSRRVTRLGAANCANSAMASFSLWSRSARGWLKTLAPWFCASSSSQVPTRYSASKGGSLRINTASNSASGVCFGASVRYQKSFAPVSVSREQSASTRPPFHIRSSWRAKCSSWPRFAASTIMA